MAMEIERKFKLKTLSVLEGHTGSHFLQAYLAKGAVLVRVTAGVDQSQFQIATRNRRPGNAWGRLQGSLKSGVR